MPTLSKKKQKTAAATTTKNKTIQNKKTIKKQLKKQS